VTRAERKPTVAVWGHYHGRNLGDDLVASIVIEAARRRLPGAEIIAISLAPADTRERHGIAAYPLDPGLPADDDPAAAPREENAPTPGRLKQAVKRLPFFAPLRTAELAVEDAGIGIAQELPFLVRSYGLLRRVDLVVVAGSGVLADNWGAWRHPYASFRWALLARLARVPMVFASVGAGPIETPAGRFFIKRAVGWSSRVSVRDADSLRALGAAGIGARFAVVPDMAFALPDRLKSGAVGRAGTGAAKVVGLNVMAHQDPRYFPSADRARYDSYLQKMAALSEWLLVEGYAVRLFSSQTTADLLVAADLRRLLDERGRCDLGGLEDLSDRIRTVPDLLSTIGGCDVVVAARFHAVLLALELEVPVLGLAYHAKTSELLAAAGRPTWFLDIDHASEAELETAFRAVSGPVNGSGESRSRLDEHRAAVERQFDAIFAPFAESRPDPALTADAPEPDRTDGSTCDGSGRPSPSGRARMSSVVCGKPRWLGAQARTRADRVRRARAWLGRARMAMAGPVHGALHDLRAARALERLRRPRPPVPAGARTAPGRGGAGGRVAGIG
jgi:polysaccharide pyruvyl transferase WcaK-like protein